MASQLNEVDSIVAKKTQKRPIFELRTEMVTTKLRDT